MTIPSHVDGGRYLTADEAKRWDAYQRYLNTPKPFPFIRIRLQSGGHVEWLRDILEDEVESLLEDLGKLRADKANDDPEVIELEQNIRYGNLILRDIQNGFIDLVGPGYERR